MTENHLWQVYRDALRKLGDLHRTDRDSSSLKYDLADLRRGLKYGLFNTSDDQSFSKNHLLSVARAMITQLENIESDDLFHGWAEEICDTREDLSSEDVALLVETVVRRIRRKSANGYCIAKMCYSIVQFGSQIENSTTRDVASVICDYLEQETGRFWNLQDHLYVLQRLSSYLPQEDKDQICMSVLRRLRNDGLPENRAPLVAFLEMLSSRCSGNVSSTVTSAIASIAQ